MQQKQKPKKKLLDEYTRRARLYPALIVALPLAVATLSWFSDDLAGFGSLWGVIVWCGGTFFLAQLGRDMGLNKQEGLFDEWGGALTTRGLRHRDALNEVTLNRYHRKLEQLIPDTKISTPEEEQADEDATNAADKVYESCVTFLKEATRDKTKFPLVFEENCNYGFRRNLWGMKSVGITTSSIGIASAIVQISLIIGKDISFTRVIILCGIVNLVLTLIWFFVIKKKWVKTAADAYAERLLASIDVL